MSSVYDQLSMGGQARYNGIRRKLQFFSTFAGGAIEALRESGYRLCAFEKQPEVDEEELTDSRGNLRPRHRRQRGNGNIELFFEQADRDQCRLLIIPYRSDLPFLAKGRFVAQLGLELSRYCNDPDVLRQAVAVNARASFGSYLGGKRLPKLYLDSPGDIKPPGTMTFELRGARLVVAMNVLANLGKYRMSDFDLDIEAIREDLQVYFYGLEKYLALLLESFQVRPATSDVDSPVVASASEEDLEAEEHNDPDAETQEQYRRDMASRWENIEAPPPPPMAGAPMPPTFVPPSS